MTADEPTGRAPHVCNNCKARKKACDKALPTCSHCRQRGVECLYGPPSGSQTEGVSVGSIADLLVCDTGPALDGIVNLQVCHVIHRTGLSIDQLAARFFRYFHQWLPIVSPTTFRETTARHQHGVPPADFSILLLAMYVIVLRPASSDLGSRGDQLQPKDLYTTLKVFFGHIQAKLCTSIFLTQAEVLITSYEYACGKPGGAYITLGTALRMGYVLELQHSVRTNTLHQGLHLNHSRAEQRNLWWGVIVMERLIVLELPSKSISLSTRYPQNDFEFPTDLHDETWGSSAAINGTGRLPSHVPKDVFAKVAKATYYLDEALAAIGNAGVTETVNEFDSQILEYLKTAMKSSDHAPHSDALAIATRSLMLCNQVTLDRLAVGENRPRQHTENTLDTAATMILEAAHDHHEHLQDIDSVSLSCYYCLDIALQQYEKRTILQHQGHIAKAADSARALMKVFRERWPTP